MSRNQILWLTVLCAGLCLWVETSAQAAAFKTLHGHVPPAARLQPSTGRLAPERRLELAIGLPVRNAPGLTNLLQQLYDLNSPRFHRYLTPEQFAEQFGPAEQDYQAIVAFAQASGFTVIRTHPNRMLLDVSGSVADIERAFHVTLGLYPHPREARQFYAPDAEPSVEASLPMLDISGLSDYGRPRPMHFAAKPLAVQPAGTGSASGSFIGNDFRAAYAPGTLLTGSNQTVGLLQFDGFHTSDITTYEAQAGLTNVPLQTILLNGFSGTPYNVNGNAEVSLDIEMVVSMAPGLAKVIVYEGNPTNFIPNDPLNRMATDNLASQLSSSWGWSGGPSATTDQILQQFITQGQSYFQASGDDDAYTGLEALDQFSHTTTPMDSPYLTCVGGTTLTTTGPGGSWSSETVWNWGNNQGSGGGVSSHYSLPAWQANLSMTSSLGSTNNRNIPDVAMTADNIYIRYNNGSSLTVGGTSCAAPLWAGFAALINQQAALAGQSPIGFLNPAIYALGQGSNYTTVLHDIATGNNIGTNTPGKYNAVAGYDLCTGWGTPTGTNLINALAPLVFAPVIVPNNYSLVSESSTPTNNRIDPWETVTLSFSLRNNGAAASTNLVATLQASGGVLAPSASQPYGALAPLGGSASRPFTFTAAGACGSSILATLQLQDGASSLGSVSFPLSVGLLAPGQTLAQNFDSVTAPALPAGWTSASVSGAANNWVTSTASKDTSPNSAFCTDSANAGANALVSPTIPIVLTSAQLTFRHSYKFEKSGSTIHDGGVLEIRIGSGAFTDIVSAGGSFVSGGYNGTISQNFDNPLKGRAAWEGSTSGSFKTVSVNLPASAAGQNVQLRWVFGTDSGNSGTVIGWYVDSISLHDATLACNTVSADLAAGLSITQDSLSAGANLEYTITITNAGPQPAANVVVTDAIPANVTFVSASPGCTFADGKVVCPIGTLAGASFSNISVVLAPASSGSFSNSVRVGTVTPDPNLTNNTAALAIVQTGGVPPQITAQPTNQLALAGSVATFQAAASGTGPLSYQWFFNATNAVAGATANVLTLTNVQPSQAGAYTLFVSGAYGSATSSPASLAIAQPPSITVQPTNRFALPGGSAAFQVAAAGTEPLSYQWFFDATNLLSEPTATLTLANLQPEEAGGYTVLVSNPYGSATSSVADLVIARPPFITTQPTNQVVVAGSSANFQAAVTGTDPMIYQWFFNATNPLAGATTNILVLANVQPAQAGAYSLFVSNLYGSATSIVASLLVAAPPAITTQPTNQFAFPSNLAGFQVTASGTDPLGYQWFFNTTNLLDGAATNTLTLTNVQPAQAGDYTVLITNLYGSVTSSVASLVLGQAPLITVQPTTQTLPAGSNAMFSLMVSGTAPLVYQWFFNGSNPIPGAMTNTLCLTNVQLADAGLYSALVTNLGGLAISDSVLLRVLVPPQFDPSNLSLAPGQANISFQSVTGLAYTLEYTLTLTPPQWTPILPPTTGTGGTILLTDTNALPELDTRFYRIRSE